MYLPRPGEENFFRAPVQAEPSPQQSGIAWPRGHHGWILWRDTYAPTCKMWVAKSNQGVMEMGGMDARNCKGVMEMA
jgi:hypothetical protein